MNVPIFTKHHYFSVLHKTPIKSYEHASSDKPALPGHKRPGGTTLDDRSTMLDVRRRSTTRTRIFLERSVKLRIFCPFLLYRNPIDHLYRFSQCKKSPEVDRGQITPHLPTFIPISPPPRLYRRWLFYTGPDPLGPRTSLQGGSGPRRVAHPHGTLRP